MGGGAIEPKTEVIISHPAVGERSATTQTIWIHLLEGLRMVSLRDRFATVEKCGHHCAALGDGQEPT